MLVVGIDVAAEAHQVVAVVDERETLVVKPTAFAEDAAGFAGAGVGYTNESER